MARRDDILGVTGAGTVIGSGVSVTGDLVSEDDILIDGHLTGKVETTGVITVGINGIIEGPVTAETVIIAGTIHGNVTAISEVTVRESGQLRGNVTASSLAIGQGGIFAGTNTIRDTPLLNETTGKRS